MNDKELKDGEASANKMPGTSGECTPVVIHIEISGYGAEERLMSLDKTIEKLRSLPGLQHISVSAALSQ